MNSQLAKTKKGFGLISLLIVIAIIGILAVGGLYIGSSGERKSTIEINRNALKRAEELQKTVEERNKIISEIIGDNPPSQSSDNLDLSNKGLTDFPKTILSIGGLKKLNLSHNQLKTLPAEIGELISLEELDISNNQLTGAFPAEIRKMSNLRILDLSNNKMTGVPAEVGQLKYLEVLNLSNNQLTGLPYEMGNLKNLETLNLSGNNYSKQDLEIIRRSLPNKVNIIL